MEKLRDINSYDKKASGGKQSMPKYSFETSSISRLRMPRSLRCQHINRNWIDFAGYLGQCFQRVSISALCAISMFKNDMFKYVMFYKTDLARQWSLWYSFECACCLCRRNFRLLRMNVADGEWSKRSILNTNAKIVWIPFNFDIFLMH